MNAILPVTIAVVLLAGCATSAPEGNQKPTVAASAQRVDTRSDAAACTAEQEWGHDGTDDAVVAAMNAHFEQRPSDSLKSVHVLQAPSEAYPKASSDKPVVTYKYKRGSLDIVERAHVERDPDGTWRVLSIAWSCTPTE